MPHSPILFGKRPDAAKSWERTVWKLGPARAAGFFAPIADGNNLNDNFDYDFTWHHNIPWNTLRDSFNVAFVFCNWDAVELLLDLYGMRLEPKLKRCLMLMKEALSPTKANAKSATYEKWIARFSGGIGSLLDSLSPEKQITSEDATAIMLNVAWQPWNIVEGPKESVRSDDPGGDDFDDFSLSDPTRLARYDTVKDLFSILKVLDDEYEAKKATFMDYDYTQIAWSTRLLGVLSRCKFLQNESFVKFSPEMWRVNRDGPNPITVKITAKLYHQVRRKGVGGD